MRLTPLHKRFGVEVHDVDLGAVTSAVQLRAQRENDLLER